MVKVFKFGGASVKSSETLRNLKRILSNVEYDTILMVVSAMGKTTNALERILFSACNKTAEFEFLFSQLKNFHQNICIDLFDKDQPELNSELEQLFSSLHHLLVHQEISLSYDEHYDQTVSYGELLATTIVGYYLIHEGFSLKVIDARLYVKTDQQFRSAAIDWQSTEDRIKTLHQEFKHHTILLTQGFIGSTPKGLTTTLGREGSDFTAAIFAYCLEAEEVVIWKDVPGLLNADPKRFNVTQKLEQISYAEAIELAYYGATVIHPKTIKPLQNKSIPLKVQSFLDSNNAPSVIDKNADYDADIPSYIIKENQLLISISPRDFSFMDEAKLHFIFGVFNTSKIHTNLIQTSAISLSVCIDDDSIKLSELLQSLNKDYAVKYNNNLNLLTIRHYSEEDAKRSVESYKILLEQRSRVTLQLVVKRLSQE